MGVVSICWEGVLMGGSCIKCFYEIKLLIMFCVLFIVWGVFMRGNSFMVFCLLYDCVVVCCVDFEEKIVGGIIILDIVKEKL